MLDIKKLTVNFYFTSSLSFSSDIIVSGFNFTEIYYNNLEPADGSLTFKVPFSAELANYLKLYINNDVKIEILQSDGTLFTTGYLKKSATFQKTQKNQPISIEVVNGSYMFDKTLTRSIAIENETIAYIINALLIEIGFNETQIGTLSADTNILFFTANEGDNVKKILKELCFEYGKTYRFDNQGKFQLYDLFENPPETYTQIFDGTNIQNQIQITAKEHEADSVQGSWIKTQFVQDTLLFEDTQNATDTDACQIEIQPNSYMADEENNLLEADSTLGEVLYVKAITQKNVKTDSQITWSVDLEDTESLTQFHMVAKNNDTSTSRYIRQLQLFGDAFIQSETIVEKTAEGSKTKEYEFSYIFNQNTAQNLVKQIANWYKYANFTLSLQSKVDYPLGSFVQVTEDGVGTFYAKILQKKYTLDSAIINYSLENIAEYEPSTIQSPKAIKKGSNGAGAVRGEQGSQGEQGDAGDPGFTFYLDKPTGEILVDADGIPYITEIPAVTRCIVGDLEVHLQITSIEGGGLVNYTYSGDTAIFTPLENQIYTENIQVAIYFKFGIDNIATDSTKTSELATDETFLDLLMTIGNNTKNVLYFTLIPRKVGNYLGRLSDLPTSPKIGDYFVVGKELNEAYPEYKVSCIYAWNGTEFVEKTCHEYESVAFTDVIGTANELLETNNSDVNSMLNRLVSNQVFVERLVAVTAFVENLFSKNIALQDGGVIKSNDYNGTIDDSGEITSPATSKGFAITHAGNADFYGAQFDYATITNAKISGGEVVSDNFVSGSSGFKLSSNGNAEFQNAILGGYLYSHDTPFAPCASINIGYNNNSLVLYNNKNIKSVTRDASGTYSVYFKNPFWCQTHEWNGNKYIDLYALGNAHDLFTSGFSNPLHCSINWVRNYVDGRLNVDENGRALVTYAILYFIDNNTDQLIDPVSAQIMLVITETD